jgi:hypothetical protein
MSNTFGFGGHNAITVFNKINQCSGGINAKFEQPPDGKTVSRKKSISDTPGNRHETQRRPVAQDVS